MGQNGSSSKDAIQEDVHVVVVSAEPQVHCSNRDNGSLGHVRTFPESYVSSKCRMGEHAAQGEANTPELAYSGAGDAEDSLSFHQPYPRWLLLAHHVVSLRIAKGPPGLEGELEVGRVAGAQIGKPPVVRAISSFCM